MPLRIAICQVLMPRDLEASRDRILDWLTRAAAVRADVAVFPEVALGGYLSDRRHYDRIGPDAYERAEGRIVEAAARLGIAAIVGTVRWGERGLYNSLLIVDRGGRRLGHYDKLHAAEPWSSPGQRLVIHNLCGVPSGFIICYDWRFPEVTRLYAAAGAKVIYCCAHHEDPSVERKSAAWDAIPIARAAENHVFFVSVTPPACRDDLPAGSHGRSRIIDPDGNALATGGMFTEELVVAEVEPAKATGRHAIRALEDETPLRGWLADGVKHVTVDPPAERAAATPEPRH